MDIPISRGIVYFLTSGDGVFKKQKERYAAARSVADASAAWELEKELPVIKKKDALRPGQSRLFREEGIPVYTHTRCCYFL
ncbi:MAG: hypothetical protein ACLSB9_25090 [Hydrogeniiclostridium mannosilyticum]